MLIVVIDMSSVRKDVYIRVTAETGKATSAFQRFQKSISRTSLRIAMLVWGASFGFQRMARGLETLTEAWTEAVKTIEQATIRLDLAITSTGQTLEQYSRIIQSVSRLGIYSEQDIKLGMSYIATLNLTSEEASRLADIIGQLAIVTGSYADASQVVVNFIERGYVAGLKQLGIYTNLNAVKEYALAILGEEWNKLSEVEKQYVRYRYFIDQASTSIGILTRYQNTYTVSMMRLNTTIQQFNTTMGQALVPTLQATNNILIGVYNWFNNLDNATKSTIATVVYFGQAVSNVSANLFFMISSLTALTSLLRGLKAAFLGLTVVQGVTGAFKDAISAYTEFGSATLSVSLLLTELKTAFAGLLSTITAVLPYIALIATTLGVVVTSFEKGRSTIASFIVTLGQTIGIYSDLNAKQQAYQSALEDYKKAQEELQNVQASYQQQLNQISIQLSVLTFKYQLLNKEIARLETSVRKAERAYTSTLDKVNRLQEQATRIMERIADISDRIIEADHNRTKAQWALNDAIYKVTQAERRLQEAHWRVTEATWGVQRASWNLEKARRKSIEASWRQRDASNAVAKARINVMRRTLELHRIEWELYKLRREYLDIQRDVLFAENRLAIARQRWGIDSWEAYEAEQNLKNLLEKKKESEEKLREKEEERNIALEEIKQAQYGVVRASRELTRAMWEMRDASYAMIEAQQDYQRALWNRIKAEWEVEDRQHELEQAQHDRIEAEWRLADAIREYNKLLQEKQKLETELTNILKDKEDLEKQLPQLYEDWQTKLKELNEKKNELLKIEQDLDRLQRERLELIINEQKEVGKLKEKLDELGKRVADLKKDYEEARKGAEQWWKDQLYWMNKFSLGLTGLTLAFWDWYKEQEKVANKMNTLWKNVTQDVIDYAQNMHDDVVGHSIIPEMWRKIRREFERGVLDIRGKLEELRGFTINMDYLTRMRNRPRTPEISNVNITLNVERLESDNVREIVDEVWREFSRRVRMERGVYV